MKLILFSADINIVDEWKKRYDDGDVLVSNELVTLEKNLKSFPEAIVIVDYDSLAAEFNKLLSKGTFSFKSIVLESVPEIITGKMLISHGVNAYGNSRMLALHFTQMLDVVQRGDIWTYPELTAALVKQEKTLSPYAKELIEHRLTQQEIKVLYAILEGLTNDGIANKLGITTRTIKAHISSIFSKLHVNDRVSLILLLK